MIDLASIPAYLSKFVFELLRKLGLYRGLQHTCEIRAYDKRGKLIAFRFIRQKLMLDNFKNLLAEVLYPEVYLAPEDYRTATLVDIGGVTRAPAVFSSDGIDLGYPATFSCVSYKEWTYGARIRVGTGTLDPTRADYALQSEVADGIPTQTVGADFIAWAVAITLETAADIAEAGLSCYYQYAKHPDAPASAHFLLFRDTFTAVPVPATGAISIQEKLTF